MRGDDGWYAFEPTPWNRGALELYYWTLDPRDHERVSDHPWIAFLDGGNPEFPVQRLEWALATVRERIARVRADTSTRDTRLSEDPNGLNPAEMVLAAGAAHARRTADPPHRRAVAHPSALFSTPELGRAGIPEQVASLVTGFAPGEDGADTVEVTLVNLDPVRAAHPGAAGRRLRREPHPLRHRRRHADRGGRPRDRRAPAPPAPARTSRWRSSATSSSRRLPSPRLHRPPLCHAPRGAPTVHTSHELTCACVTLGDHWSVWIYGNFIQTMS